MIEAVNSVVSNASLLRQSAQQATSAAVSSSSNSSLPGFGSLQIEVDTNFDTAVLQVRDSETGDVLRQFPNESTLQSRQRAEAVRDRAEALRAQRDANSGRSSIAAIQESRAESASETSGQAAQTQAVAIAQQAEAPQQSIGAGGAQVAIAALSTGAQSGQQPDSGNVSVTA